MTDFAAFYERAGDDTFAATRATTSPWDERLQHGSPPTALLVRCALEAHPNDAMRVGRIAAEFLGPIPRKTLRVSTRVVRPGSRVELLEAMLWYEKRPVAHVHVWRIVTQPPGSIPAGITAREIPPARPDAATGERFGIPGWGYWEAFEWRFEPGSTVTGPNAVWTRPRVPLVAGEPLAPLDRALLIVDSANGISGELPLHEFMFVPPSLSVALLRYPRGEWTLLEARTAITDDGLGATTLRLADDDGYLGVGTQTLYVAAR